MEDDLICNYKKCRKRLNTVAWVTSCSHIFCEEDGNREFGQNQKCPACETELLTEYDIVRVDLQPSEQYKSMIMAGLRPELIMEICSRAMSFWTYQAHQERAFQEYRATKAIEKTQQQEHYYEKVLAVNQSELTSLKSQVVGLKKEVEALKAKYNETSEKLLEKNRQYQKLQGVYEAMRRRSITPASFEADRPTPRHRPSFKPHPFDPSHATMPDKDYAGLPHHLYRKQVAEFQLQSAMPFTMVPNPHAIASQTQPQLQTNAQPLDPQHLQLAQAVNMQAMHQHALESKAQERGFTIKMAAHHTGKANK